jgi:adenylosuccinate synthase
LCTTAGVTATFGIHHFDRVIGVTKAYTTRVGAGPFPTELFEESGEILRRHGHEYGTTTGRPRRCGWLDMVALSYACRMGGIRELVVTKLDVLRHLGELHVGIEYRSVHEPLATLRTSRLQAPRLILKEHPVWIEDISKARSLGDLPVIAQSYISFISSSLQIPVTGVGVGPERDQFFWTANH